MTYKKYTILSTTILIILTGLIIIPGINEADATPTRVNVVIKMKAIGGGDNVPTPTPRFTSEAYLDGQLVNTLTFNGYGTYEKSVSKSVGIGLHTLRIDLDKYGHTNQWITVTADSDVLFDQLLPNVQDKYTYNLTFTIQDPEIKANTVLINALQTLVNTIQNSITTIQASIVSLQTSVTTLQSDNTLQDTKIASLTNKDVTLSNKDMNLQSQITTLENPIITSLAPITGGNMRGIESNILDIASDNSGNLYIVDYFYLYKINPTTGIILDKWGNEGSETEGFTGSYHVTVDSGKGFVYVHISDASDPMNVVQAIQMFNSDGTFIVKWIVI